MGLPRPTRVQIIEALQRFDHEYRQTDEWVGWEDSGAQRFALRRGTLLYPPKLILALAANVPVGSFSGGEVTNTYLKKQGFEVIALKPPRAQAARAAIPPGVEAATRALFVAVADLLGGLDGGSVMTTFDPLLRLALALSGSALPDEDLAPALLRQQLCDHLERFLAAAGWTCLPQRRMRVWSRAVAEATIDVCIPLEPCAPASEAMLSAALRTVALTEDQVVSALLLTLFAAPGTRTPTPLAEC